MASSPGSFADIYLYCGTVQHENVGKALHELVDTLMTQAINPYGFGASRQMAPVYLNQRPDGRLEARPDS